MIDRIDIRPSDRVLLLSIPEPAIVAELAARLPAGLIVALGSDDEVREARRASRHLENVMFAPVGTEQIPWQDGFFSVAIAFDRGSDHPDPVASELARVLSPGGRAFLTPRTVIPGDLAAAGFRDAALDGPLLVATR
jgi:hypothetical protein